jgi:hypothetical protein
MDAGHCLAADHRDWLNVASEKPYEVELGLVASEKADSGKAPIYLIQYTTPTHTEGVAFAFESRGKDSHRKLVPFVGRGQDPHRDLVLQFQTQFHQTDDGSQKVSLVDPPLGGVATQEEILAAIQQVGFHTWRVPVANLRNYSGSAQCNLAEAAK